ncbi:calcium-transporting P [Cylindrobasidium torrendii FP15055 ss-10]|uniref:P-type Ca(2+) transporter n=1 Tax=Cylindrobasidium torrendii FP15055 ss-10 TaxID=1314674 RepID=A0A0D7BI89_9AGAR|nr:calcium-transporting P [Cylindrobasidium torrendii FP15055 ss-10]
MNQRPETPPASTYFPLLSENPDDARLQPLPDAESHFAYSTTLRRHSQEPPLGSPTDIAAAVEAEASSLWSRARAHITGEPEHSIESGRGTPLPPQPPQDTLSARFAHTSVEDTISHYRTSLTGLYKSDINTLRATHGYNEFRVEAPESMFLKFAKTIYESPLILLLCTSAIISAVMGNIDDAVSITVAVLIVLTVGFVQEQRSEKSLEALNKLVPHHCHVIREQETLHVLANELVPGDIVTFSTGDRIPADVRLTSSVDLEVDESSLTGETIARQKDINTCSGPFPASLADRTCIAYMGTLVRMGRGTGVVVATGTNTEFGVVFTMMQDVEEKRSPLQRSMDELAQKLSFISFGIIGVICLIGVLQKRSWLEMFTIGVSLAVAAIPEGLPIVTTVTLALGVQRMAHRKAIVKKLHSVEALGSVSVVCSDKTGTLTKNEQTVVEAYSVDEVIYLDPDSAPPSQLPAAVRKAVDIGALCNNSSVRRNQDGHFVGQATDVALLNILYHLQLPDRRVKFNRLTEKPFNSEHKYMAVSGVHQEAGSSEREMCYIKGSIDAVLERCRFYYVNDDSTPALDQRARSVIIEKAKSAATKGLRVVAMAYGYGNMEASAGLASDASRPGTRASSPAPSGFNLVFAGFQAMLDPPRKGVSDSIALLQSGGVQVVMITGDAEETAVSIAQKLGLRMGAGGCLTGTAIDQMSKAQLQERVGTVSVFARTTPRHKMAIVDAFQARGKVVAMTGDGVNDAPALKMSDIGVSMGRSGTDVAKEAADVILVDDNFSTILPAIEEGKSIFHNIQNFLSFQLSTAAAALSLITLSTLLGLSNPLNAMQILFINILMDGPPSQSLGVDPVDPAVMRRPPRRKDASILTKRLMYRVLFSATIIVIGTLFVYTYAYGDERMSRREQTMTFTAFVFLDLVSAVQNRGLGCGLTQNKMLVTTVSVSFIVQLGLVYVPMMQSIFQTEGLEMGDLSMLLMLGGLSFLAHQGRRKYEREGSPEEEWGGVVREMV